MLGIILGTLAVVLATVALGILIDRRFRLLPRPDDLDPDAARARERKQLATHGAGEAPATALRLRAHQIAKLRTTQPCPTCRAPMTAEPDDTVRFDDRDLLVLHVRCPRCHTPRSLYIDPID